MSSRVIDLKNLESIEVGVAIIGKLIHDIERMLEINFVNSNQKICLKNWLDELKIVYHKYKNIESGYFSILKSVYGKIMKKQIERDFLKCFEIEDKVSKMVAIVWNKQMSNPDTFINGDSFKFLIHATNGLSKKVDSSYICCSLITDNHIVTANGKLCLALNVDESNFICANKDDCATIGCNINEIKDSDKIKCVNNYKNNLVITYNCTKENPITKTTLPVEIEKNSIKNKKLFVSKRGHNEVVLNSSNLDIKAIILISNGCDFLFDEYKEALKIQKMYKVDIKIINKSLYQIKRGLIPFSKDDLVMWEKLLDKYSSSCALQFFRNMGDEEIEEFLDKYYNDVVLPGCYDVRIKKQIDETIDKLKCLSKHY